MELIHCICDCVHKILQSNIPVNDIDKESLKRHSECLRLLVKKKTSDKKRKHLIQEGGFLGALIPILFWISRKTVHWTMVDKMESRDPPVNIRIVISAIVT